MCFLRKKSVVVSCLLALAAVSCSEVDNLGPGGDEGREPISFSVSDGDARLSRAGFCAGPTYIAMRIQSDNKKGGSRLYTRTTATASRDVTNTEASYSDVTFTDAEKRYWDDAHGQYSLLSVYAVAIPNMAKDVMEFVSTPLLQPGSTTRQWGSNDDNTIRWKVSTDQTKDNTSDNAAVVTALSSNIDKEDLVYSNNIRSGGTDGVYRWNFGNQQYEPTATGEVGAHEHGQMTFISQDNIDNPLHTPSSMQGKFDKGHLVFRHALSRITVELQKGTGFDTTPFKFADNTTITLLGMKTAGTLNLATGTWSAVTTGNINKMARIGSGETAAGTFMGQMLPGYDLKDGNATPVMEFTIDGSTYYVTQDMLYDALDKDVNRHDDCGYNSSESKFTMMPGKNYKFAFNIKKRQVEVASASLVNWEDVTADDIAMNNARIKLQVEERGTPQTANVAIYKADDSKTTDGIDDGYTTWNWKTGYATLSATYINGKWTTNYFWETSKDFYHFRALMPAATVVTTDRSGDGDYATLASGSAYTDICWGAPMLDDGINETDGSFKWLYGPTSGGFDHSDDNKVADGLPAGTAHQIYKAIGATEDPVKLTLFHMMSDLTFNIKTTSDADAVTFVDGVNKTKVEIVGFYPGGKVLLGTGLVKTTGDKGTQEVAWNTESPTGTHVYKYGAVPQGLTDVVLRITTPDNNKYEVDLKDVKATTVSSVNLANPYTLSDGKYEINSWYPGFKYTYTFTLKKTGITNLQATVVDWESVTAADETVTIK